MILTREWLCYLLPILANQNNHYNLDQHFPKNNAALLNILYMFIKQKLKSQKFFPYKRFVNKLAENIKVVKKYCEPKSV